MKKQGSVSLWVGNTKSVDDLNEFLKITYDEDGDLIPSRFARAFKTGRYDDFCREAKFFEQPLSGLNELSKGFSYYDIIMPKFEEFAIKIKEPFNSVIFLYNFEYDEKLKHYDNGTFSFDYIGSVEYE